MTWGSQRRVVIKVAKTAHAPLSTILQLAKSGTVRDQPGRIVRIGMQVLRAVRALS